jgi:hypothetical protein
MSKIFGFVRYFLGFNSNERCNANRPGGTAHSTNKQTNRPAPVTQPAPANQSARVAPSRPVAKRVSDEALRKLITDSKLKYGPAIKELVHR